MNPIIINPENKGSGSLKVSGKILAMIASRQRFVVKLSRARVEESHGYGEHFEPMRLQPNVDRLRLPLVPAQFNFLVNKPSKVLNRVQKGLKLELNSWSPFFVWFVVGKLRLNRTLGDQLLSYPPARSFFHFLIFGSLHYGL
jgi:hypothetical protein